MRKLDAISRELIVALLQTSVRIEEIARQVHCSAATVRRLNQQLRLRPAGWTNNSTVEVGGGKK